ncbi:MAG: efflux transporter outer membrane subunit [Desulfobacteraceae bacterium]|nr:efflux transporter outer membrane subunit [Desulfobacteraceae bacterium]
MKRKLIILLMSAAVILPGCTMIPKYTRPEAPVPSSWPTGDAYKNTSEQGAPAPIDVRWRDFFQDERLQTVIGTALENNRDLRLAALNVEKTRALYRIQRAEILPVIEGTGKRIHERIPAEISGTDYAVTAEQYSLNLGFSSWEIDFFGRIRSLTKSALEDYFGTEQARRSAQILLIAELANAYLALAADRENLSLAQSTLEAQQASYNLIRRRQEVGLVHELDLRQSQTRVDSARVDVAKYTQLVAQDKNALDLLAGSPVPDNLLPEALSGIAAFRAVSPGMSSEVLLQRPDILQAEHALKAANANIGAARAALFPRISLTTSLGTASGDLTGLFQSGSMAWNYTPQLVMPIFDPRTWAALEAVKVQRKIVVAQYEKVIQTAFREVADALAKKGTLDDQVEAQQSLVDATAEAYRLSKARYEKGTDIYLIVLDAQRSLYSAQQGLISLHLAKVSNQARLYSVLGGGGDEAKAP